MTEIVREYNNATNYLSITELETLIFVVISWNESLKLGETWAIFISYSFHLSNYISYYKVMSFMQ
jgi:hypothetical protein